jgi:hypothetical protein
MSRGGAVQLLRYWCNRRRKCHLEIVAASTEVDDVGIVSVAKDPVEEAVAEALTVTTEQLERLPSQCRRGDNTITLHHRSGGTFHEVERFISRQALTAATDVVLGMGAGGRGVGRCGARHWFRARRFPLTIGCRAGSLRFPLTAIVPDLSVPDLSVPDLSVPNLPIALATTATATTTAASTAVTHEVIALTVA